MQAIMRKLSLCILATNGIAVAAYAAPVPTASPALKAVLRKLSSNASAAEVGQIEQAIHASPALLGQLNALASSGKLKSITVKPGDLALVENGASFGAAFDAKGMVFSEALLDKQRTMAYDVRTPNEILPNNTVFLLGHLAYHLRDPQYVGLAKHWAANEDEFLAEVMRNEAAAFIQGWNDVVSAATVANGNKPLSPRQVGDLMINLRYRLAFIKAMNAKASQKLKFSKGGRVAPSDQNLNALAAALENKPMAGLE